MGFFRQKYQSGLPFPSPVHVSEVTQSCLTPRNPMDCSPPGSSVHGIFQARVLEWAAMPSSRGSSRLRDRTCVSCVSCIAGGFFATVPPGKPRRDVDCPPLGCPPTPVMVWSTDGEGAGWRVRAEQAAPVSTGNSVLPATSRVTQGSAGIMRVDQVGSIAKAGPRATLFSMWALSSSLFTKN